MDALENPGLPRELLLDQVSWIRRLARELVGDRDLAEDLVQDACVIALEQRPRDERKLRSWLGTVLRNLARESRRGALRRRGREERSAREEAQEGTDRLVEQVALQRELVGAVLELDEPYRTAILLRFFEELPPREIARRTGAPLATVNSRLQRALFKLRGRLDAEHRTWASLLLPLVRGLEPLGTPTLLTVMNVKIALSAAALVAAAGAYLWIRDDQGGRPPADALRPALAAAPSPSASHTAPERGPERVPPDQNRVPLALPRDPSPPATATAAPSMLVRGRVLDAEGEALAGLALAVVSASADASRVVTRSALDGSFSFTASTEAGGIVVAEPGWVTVLEGRWRSDSSYVPVVVAAPALELGGTVTDANGFGLASARVRLELPEGFSARFEDILEATSAGRWTGTADARGVFALSEVPAVAGAQLRTVLEGYAPDLRDAPASADRTLVIVLERPAVALAGALRGRVIDELGRPVDGARVACGLTSARSDASGEFMLDLTRAVTAESVRAVHAGYQACELERPGTPGADSTGWPDFVVLRLSVPTLSIRGTVVDGEDEPIAGAKVWLADPTPFGILGIMPASAEYLAAGASVPPEALEARPREQDGDSFNDWHYSSAPPTALWNYVETDSRGRFALEGLLPRSYKVNVLSEKPLGVHTTHPIPAGAGQETIRLPIPGVFPELRGRVLTDRGVPVAGARVKTWLSAFDHTTRVFGGRARYVMKEPGDETKTDAEGRFTLRDVPREGVQLFVGADGIVPSDVDVTPAANAEDFVVSVHERCHLQVELEPPIERADEFAFENEEGEGVDVMIIRQGSTNAYTSHALSEGRSPVVSVSSEATMLLLLKNGQVVDRVPLDLLPGEVNLIRR